MSGRADLCRGIDGRGDGPYRDKERLPVWFTCADKATPPDSFPCTGSKHAAGVRIDCTCECHRVRTVAEHGFGGTR